jgi:hypothetical protein
MGTPTACPLQISAMTPPPAATILASPAPPSVSVSVSFSAVHGRSDETQGGSRSDDRSPMNAGERPRTQPRNAPPQLESVQVSSAYGGMRRAADAGRPGDPQARNPRLSTGRESVQ